MYSLSASISDAQTSKGSPSKNDMIISFVATLSKGKLGGFTVRGYFPGLIRGKQPDAFFQVRYLLFNFF